MINSHDKKGFTLIEILIAVTIFAVICSIALVNFKRDQNARDLKMEAMNVENMIKKSQTMALSGQSVGGQFFDKFFLSAANCDSGSCSSLDLKGNSNPQTLIESLALKQNKIVGVNSLIMEFDSPRAQGIITLDGANVATTSVKLQNVKDASLFKCVEFSAISGRIDVTNCE